MTGLHEVIESVAADIKREKEPRLYGARYGAEVKRYVALIEAGHRGHLDDVEIYMAAHFLMILVRVAAGREGLALCEQWLRPKLGMADPLRLLGETWAWLQRNARLRLAALDEIEELTHRAAAHLTQFGTVDIDDLIYEYDEQLFEIEEQRRGRCNPEGMAGFEGMDELARAVDSFTRTYPMRMEALDTLEKVRAARHMKPLKGGMTR